MTEEEWMECADPTPMLEFLRGKLSDRKLRLFAVACCRSIWHLLTDDRSRQVVEVAERFADTRADSSDLSRAHALACVVEQEQFDAVEPEGIVYSDDWSHEVCCDASSAASTAERAASDHPIGMSAEEYRSKRLPETPSPPGTHSVYKYAQRAQAHAASPLRYDTVRWNDTPERSAEKCNAARAQAGLIREIAGNPFRPVTSDPAWLTTDVLALARGVYEERAFDRMPILADALQDAGCDSDDVLNHCRDASATHVRGCWVVDLLLGKT